MNPRTIQSFPMLLTALATAIGISLLWLAWTVYQSAPGTATIPEPGPRINVSPANVDLFLATALQHRAEPETGHHITMAWADIGHFKSNLYNIAYQKGWYAHNSEQWDIKLVLPRQDLPQVDNLLDHPERWVNDQLAHPQPAQPTQSTDLVHIGLDVAPPHKYIWLNILASVLLIAGYLITSLAIWNTVIHVKNRHQQRRTLT